MKTRGESDEYQPASTADHAFCLADTLVHLSDAELERVCDAEAQNEVDSSAYEGIPLDKEALKTGLLASYKRLRSELAARPQRVNLAL